MQSAFSLLGAQHSNEFKNLAVTAFVEAALLLAFVQAGLQPGQRATASALQAGG
jgi:hypothetical protein